MRELVSGISPGPSSTPMGRISSPVGTTTTVGCRRTSRSVTPAAAHAAASMGRSRWPSGSRSSAALMSSPIERTCWYGGTAARISARSASRCTSSRMITASYPGGIGSPVSTTANAAPASTIGRVSEAPTVSSARTAIPSMAAESNAGEERAAHTGPAVTLPTASATGRRTASTRAGQPAAARASRQATRASAAGTSEMYGLSLSARSSDRPPGASAGRSALVPPRSRCEPSRSLIGTGSPRRPCRCRGRWPAPARRRTRRRG
jgi:hypothetical protein